MNEVKATKKMGRPKTQATLEREAKMEAKKQEAVNKKEEMNRKLKLFLESNSIHYYYNDNSEHVFVYNNTDKTSQNHKLSYILLPLDDKRTIRIENRKIPMDLTEQATKEEIINNSIFMDLLSSRQILICPEKEAFEVRSTEFAKKELAAMRENTAPTLDELFGRKDIEVLEEKTVSSEMQPVEVNLTVLECMNREDMSQEERYSTIRNNAESLNKTDWKYIYDNAGADTSLKEYALTHL